ncbi:6-aminohexanoate-dimer hydrolase [Ruegeria sp. TM1040]|uniref:serine hydrolase domain-containing protein n=1 Tax=Ruegeria sp. (strain TM1040) TaxID=292414 RepID=UPI0000557B5D|nr:serine hydrolase [Ruegeria sp. TM1040]ABF65539.1 6-aminohexanoate-dimer hydrolase [Ruegeria sp. TM1040]
MSSSTSNFFAATLAAAVALVVSSQAGAQSAPLSAQESDPNVMGWMQGFPPPADKIITQPDSVYFSFPRLRWSVCHLREFLPTEEISRGLSDPVPLTYPSASEFAELRAEIDAVTFMPQNSDAEMTWEQSLYANYTDGMLILHKGEVVYERYFGCLEEGGKHAIMSMTKSFTGLVAEIMVVEGLLDDTALVRDIIPEIGDSAFATATVRQVMDMTTGVQYSEDYSDPNADIWLYSKAASPLPKPEGYVGPNGYWEYLQQVAPEGNHGDAFHYKTINSDMLGWIISRVSGQSVTDIVSDRLWRRMGVEQDAYQTVDAKGVPFAGGGITAGLRDLGRLGQLMLNEGELNGQRLFPTEVVAKISAGGDRSKFGDGFPTFGAGSYTSQWWVLHNAHGAYAARGVHGQTIYVDPTAEMVLVRLSSFPKAQNGFIDPTSLPAYQAVAEHLMATRP